MVLAKADLTTGMTIMMAKKPYRVESASRSQRKRQIPLSKLSFCSYEPGAGRKKLSSNTGARRGLPRRASVGFLYAEGSQYVFLDLGTLDLVRVSREIFGKKIHYLKEGIEVKGACFGTGCIAIFNEAQALMKKQSEFFEDADSQRIEKDKQSFVELQPTCRPRGI